MQRAALYARVSTDAQKQEGTIESQIAELRRQIAAAGHVLVKEYIDDGYTGSRMDRPALQELRRDLRADVFDVIYFLAADRIARAVIYQTIIIGEMLLYKKDIVINGQQYIDKSENKFTMTVLGAVAELERAKITERMTRGKLHRLRQGVMASGGVAPFGYQYTQPSPNAPRALVPKELEAAVVRWMFETYAAGATLRSLAKSLEQRGVRTRFGKELWAYAQIRDMMKNPAYAGMRYFNRRTEVKDDPRRKRGRTTCAIARSGELGIDLVRSGSLEKHRYGDCVDRPSCARYGRRHALEIDSESTHADLLKVLAQLSLC